jgi:FixJ family two-component response regulator
MPSNLIWKEKQADTGPVPLSAPKRYQSTMDANYRQAHRVMMESQKESGLVERPLVSVVDDDESVRESLPDLLTEFGFSVRTFSSALEFLSSDSVGLTKCLILDMAMPGMTGLELQEELSRREHAIPVIFITGHQNDGVREQALKRGAVKFLYKPFSDTALLEALNAAVPAH